MQPTGSMTGSGLFGARPGSGMRPPSSGLQSRGGMMTGRPGSTMVGMVGMGSALNTQLEVQTRPALQGGMRGVGPQSVGPGRQVADQSYYVALLRSKNAELQAEIERLRAQEEQMNKANTAAGNLGGKVQEFETTIQGLKAKLADFNFMLAKATSGVTDVETLSQQAEELKARNAADRGKADAVFLDVKKTEARAKESEELIQTQLRGLDDKLNADPEKRATYYSLREQSSTLQDELLPKQRELEVLQKRYMAAASELSADTGKQRALEFQKKKRGLEKKKESLEEEIRQSEDGQLPDEKNRLLAQVKTDTADIENMQKGMEDLRAEMQRLKDQVHQVDQDLQEYTGERAEKYKELEAKDKEMQEFIDKFDETKQETLSEMHKVEENIVKQMEGIGKGLLSKAEMPSQAEVEEMKADLTFKQQQKDYSMSTHERLKNELELRKKELEKVNNLDAKITSELEAITEKITSHEDGIKKYSNLEALRQDADQQKRELMVMKNRSLKLRDHLKQSVRTLSETKFDKMRQSLTEDEVHASIQSQEHKIRLIQQQVFALSDFIAQKGSEADYYSLRVDCLKMCDDINTHLKEVSNPK